MAMKFSRLTKPEIEEIIKNANFTDEEEQIFRLLARGLSLKEISFRLSICLSTLCRRVSAIKNKVKRLDVIL